MSETKSIMIVGVGGQGTLLASRILGSALMSYGHDVKLSEVHGMSQRGGSVVTYVKYGDKVYSPLVDRGEADYILSFERLEAARWLGWLKKGGELIVNDQRINPMPVIPTAYLRRSGPSASTWSRPTRCRSRSRRGAARPSTSCSSASSHP